MILEVACPIPVFKNFDYLPPPEFSPLNPSEIIGRRVEISFGFKKEVGIVTRIKETSDFPIEKLKPVVQFLDNDSLLSEEMMALGHWLSERYVCSFGEALFFMLPPGRGNPQSFEEPESDIAYHDDYLSQLGTSPTLTKDQQTAVDMIHRAIFNYPEEQSNESDGEGSYPTPSRPRFGEIRNNVRGRAELDNSPPRGFPLSFLLLGAAATGKTEVYLEAIKDVLSQGKTALYLVPEISLALQLSEVLKNRFGDKNVLHWRSDQGQKSRVDNWLRIKNGEFSIIIGSRATVLAPLPHLGLIIVDEEHDSAYKEDRKPRFNAKDVALERARRAGAVAVFGSATPSLEIMKTAVDGKINLIELHSRAIPAAEPKIKLVDLKTEKPRKSFSPTLEKAINERSKLGEQSILFLNRRGFFRYAMCPKCDWMAKCPVCSIGLVMHKGGKSSPSMASQWRGLGEEKIPPPTSPIEKPWGRKKKTGNRELGNVFLKCHYCGRTSSLPPACPQCGAKKIIQGGFGTQRLTKELEEIFPWARILRWDHDSALRRGEPEKILQSFEAGEGDILVGTVMVAHGFNFPKVTLVGVMDADLNLHIPDFRAAERTFQTITQVAGRAGRAMVSGEVIIQTRNKDHYSIQFAEKMDYKGFAAEELKFREALFYPPFSHLIEVTTQSGNLKKAEKDIEGLVKKISDGNSSVGILGPTPAKRTGKKGAKRLMVLLKIPNDRFFDFLSFFRQMVAPHPQNFLINVDPQ